MPDTILTDNEAVLKCIEKILFNRGFKHEVKVNYELQRVEVEISAIIIYESILAFIKWFDDFNVSITRGKEEVIYITVND